MAYISGVDDNGNAVPLEGDSATGALTVLEYPHHAIHEGKAFSGHYAFSLANTASSAIHLIPQRSPHFRLLSAGANSENWYVNLYEMASTVATHGAAIVCNNRNRHSTKVATDSMTTFLKASSVVVATSTLLSQHFLGGSSGNASNKGGGSEAADEEWVLKPGKQYILKVRNAGSGSGICNVRFFWYDHDA